MTKIEKKRVLRQREAKQSLGEREKREFFLFCLSLTKETTPRTLTLMGCENLTDDDLGTILGGFPNIVHLDISFNPQITASSLVAMCGKHRNLTVLRLGGMMHQIGQNAVKTIAKMGKQIIA